MFNYTNTKLMYPEPEDGGSGGAPDVQPSDDNVNVFDFDLTEAEDTETPDTETEQNNDDEPETDDYALDLPEDIGLDKSEVDIITAAAKKYNIDKAAASGMVTEFTKAITENTAKAQQAYAKEAEQNLRKEWGVNFDANLKKAGALIKKIGSAAGWSAEAMNSFKNADSMRVFYDIARVMGSGKTIGLNNSASVAAPPMSKAELEDAIMKCTINFYNAQSSGDAIKAKEYSDQHMELQRQFTGKKGIRMLRY